MIGVLHPDVYQVLSYAVAFDVSDVVLVYPMEQDDDLVNSYVVRNVSKSIHVFGFDVDTNPTDLLKAVDAIAMSVRALALPAAGRPQTA